MLSWLRRRWFSVITYFLVTGLALLVGYRFGTGLSWQQMIGLWRQGQFHQITRLTNTQVPTDHSEVDFSLFWDVWNRLERDYYDATKLDAQKMVYGAISGMTSSLGDPYTVFLPPANKQRLTEDLQGEFDGVGIQLGYIKGQLAVISPLKNNPAEAAGVKPGDLIIRIIDKEKKIDKDAIGMTAEEAVTYIRGKKGTKVTLRLLAEGQQPRDVELIRTTIEIPSIETKVEESNGKRVLHVMLSRFGEKTLTEWDKVVQQMLADKKLTGMVLDMRGNPGGFLQDAIEIASDFIDGGVIVSQKGRTNVQAYSTTHAARLKNIKLVVLVNKGSASASEIVAGALRDRLHAKLIGETTFGKGSVQDAQQLVNGAGLNVTIARWLLPSGASIQDTGLPVDIEVKQTSQAKDSTTPPPDDALTRAIQEL
jgi:carboxyl-terminal processing protease